MAVLTALDQTLRWFGIVVLAFGLLLLIEYWRVRRLEKEGEKDADKR